MNSFADPVASFGRLNPKEVAGLLAGAHDLALILDRQGTVTDVAVGNPALAPLEAENWKGRSLSDTVTVESQTKIAAMLSNKDAAEPPRWRQVNHPVPPGADWPLLYYAWPIPGDDHYLLLGRELQSVAELQRRLVDAQQAMENDYARLRQTEARYRVLFQLSGEAFLIVDGRSNRSVEANDAAAEILGSKVAELERGNWQQQFEPASVTAMERLLASVRATGRTASAELVGAKGRPVVARALLFRQQDTPLFLINLRRPEGSSIAPSPFVKAVQDIPDGFVVTDIQGRVIAANDAFLDLIQVASKDLAIGHGLSEWFTRPGIDLGVMLANLNERGNLRLFQTKLDSSVGSETEVEVSAVKTIQQDEQHYAFIIRDVSRRLPSTNNVPRLFTHSIDQLTELVGRVSLKDLVRETTDMIERLYIEAALQMTGDNRASAAEVLGLSRQSLYVKLRRYGILDGEIDNRDP